MLHYFLVSSCLVVCVSFFGWTTAACKEHTTSEAWFDAEEDLKPAAPEMVQDICVRVLANYLLDI